MPTEQEVAAAKQVLEDALKERHAKELELQAEFGKIDAVDAAKYKKGQEANKGDEAQLALATWYRARTKLNWCTVKGEEPSSGAVAFLSKLTAAYPFLGDL